MQFFIVGADRPLSERKRVLKCKGGEKQLLPGAASSTYGGR